MTKTIGFLALVVAAMVPSGTPFAAEGDVSSGIDVQDCVVRFSEEVDVPSLATGRVAEVFVMSNQTVEADSRLVRIDDLSLKIRRQSYQLRLKLAQEQANDVIEVQYAETAKAEAEAELSSSHTIHKDFGGAVAANQLRRLKLAVQRAELEIDRAKKRLSEAHTAEQLAEAELALLDDQLSHLNVQSPLAGVILETSKSVGEWVQTGETVATIARMDRLHVNAILDSATISPEACVGLPVSVHWVDRASGEDRSLRGRVLSVDPHVMPGGGYRLHSEIVNEPFSLSATTPRTNPSWKLHPGAQVRMKVHVPAAIANRPRVSRDSR